MVDHNDSAKLKKLENLQALVKELIRRMPAYRLCNELGISRSAFLYWLKTSDKDLTRFRPSLIKRIIDIALQNGIPAAALPDAALPVLHQFQPPIFLCHASQDKPQARSLHKYLVSEGFNPWLDQEALVAGQDWQTEITAAIRRAAAVIVCLSSNSVDKTGFVQKEIKIALDAADERPEGRIFLIPLRIEPCSIPARLSHLHYIDFFQDNSKSILLTAVSSAVKLHGWE